MEELTHQELLKRRALLVAELTATSEKIQKGGQGVIDIHHPETSPDWPRYKYQEYPKMVYHPIKLDQSVEARRTGIRRRNEINPNLVPLDLPVSQALTQVVRSIEEEEAARELGFVATPPALQPEPEVMREMMRDPLAEAAAEEEGQIQAAQASVPRKRKSA